MFVLFIHLIVECPPKANTVQGDRNANKRDTAPAAPPQIYHLMENIDH